MRTIPAGDVNSLRVLADQPSKVIVDENSAGLLNYEKVTQNVKLGDHMALTLDLTDPSQQQILNDFS